MWIRISSTLCTQISLKHDVDVESEAPLTPTMNPTPANPSAEPSSCLLHPSRVFCPQKPHPQSPAYPTHPKPSSYLGLEAQKAQKSALKTFSPESPEDASP